MVHTKDKNDWSPSGDYRRLNAEAIPDRHPLPHINDFIDILKGTAVCLKLDLIKAYNRIPMAADHIPRTAIITHFAFNDFIRTHFGLRNVAQTFQRFIDDIFRDTIFVHALYMTA